MTSRRLSLVGYPAEYFLPFARQLEQSGFEVFWVCALRADAKYLLRNRVLNSRVLDVSHFRSGDFPLAKCREELARFENDSDPKFNDIILMDRLISKKDWRFSIEYLHYVATSMFGFFSLNEIKLVSSWRDTAIQITAMLVSRRLGIGFVVPTRIRIPQEMYGFCSAHHTESFLSLRKISAEHYVWAESFLRTFEQQAVRPGLKRASRSFLDVLQLIPTHLKAYWYELRRSIYDFGNSHTRYPLSTLMKMYMLRRINLLRYKMFSLGECDLPDERFCLYALHTQPESSIDVQASYYSDQLGLIRLISRSLPADYVLYVKVHPTDVDGKSTVYYRAIKRIPNVVLVDHSANSRALLERAAIVFSLTGTVAYEAALLRKPVIVFAKNFFNCLPTVHLCESPTSLARLVASTLARSSLPSDKRQEIVSFLATLRAGCWEGEVSRSWVAVSEGLTHVDFLQLVAAYDLIYRSVEGGIDL
jgi:hypothetical protein